MLSLFIVIIGLFNPTINLNSGTQGAARFGDTTLDNDTELNGADAGKIDSSSSTVIIGD